MVVTAAVTEAGNPRLAAPRVRQVAAARTSRTFRGRSKMRMTICRSKLILVIVGALLAPAVIGSQQPAAGDARTHTVRDGDTLWDLARTYLGDPFLWPEIYRLNPAVIEDPHWIYPGEELRLPGAGAGGEVIATGPGAPGESLDPLGPTVFR